MSGLCLLGRLFGVLGSLKPERTSLSFAAVRAIRKAMLLEYAFYDRQPYPAAHLGALMRFVALADLVVSVPDIRQIFRGNSVSMILHLKTDYPAFLADKTHYDSVVITRVGNSVIYQIVYHLLKLGDIGGDHNIVLRL